MSRLKNNLQHIPYGRQSIDQNDINAVIKVLRSDWLTQGPAVVAFEKALCDITGAKYAVAVANGTAALHLACLAAGISKGDEVITSPMTFAASANGVLYCQGKPVFADIEPTTGNMDVNGIERLITPWTKMIIPVHYAGHACDMSVIQRIAKKHKLLVLEDAAHAVGATYKGNPIGSCSHSDMAIFSFHPVKHITTGEWGAILTNNRDLYKKLALLRTHGITKEPSVLKSKQEGSWYYEMQTLGFNYRISDIHCALGLSQLKKLSRFIKRRRQIANFYNKAFANNPYFDVPVEWPYTKMSYHLYPIRLKEQYVKQRRRIFENLRKDGIGVQVHYIPVYWHPFYKSLGYRKGICPKAEKFYLSEIGLPLFPDLSQKDLQRVVKKVLASTRAMA